MIWPFLFLMLATLSLFVTKRYWVWLPFLVVAVGFATALGVVNTIGVIVIGIVGGLYFLVKQRLAPWLHGLVALVAVVVSGLMMFHMMPGFHNWLLMKGPPRYFYNFDKPFAGFFVLAFLLPVLRGRRDWYDAIVKPWPLIAVGIVILFVVGMATGLLKFGPHMREMAGAFLVGNLLLTCVPEEAFFRGFVQRELTEAIPQKWGAAAAIAITSIAFVLLHVVFTQNMAYLSMVFLASLLYGIVYHRTKAIESAILVHFLVNILHVFLFHPM